MSCEPLWRSFSEPGTWALFSRFGAAETISERARALVMPALRSSRARVVAGYLSVGLGVVGSLGWLAWAAWMSILAVSSPGLCVL